MSYSDYFENDMLDIQTIVSKYLIKDENVWLIKTKCNLRNMTYEFKFDNGNKVYYVRLINKQDYLYIEYVENKLTNYIKISKDKDMKIGFYSNDDNFGECPIIDFSDNSCIEGDKMTGKNCFLRKDSLTIRGNLDKNILYGNGVITYLDNGITAMRLDGLFKDSILIKGYVISYTKHITIEIDRLEKKDKYVIKFSHRNVTKELLDYAMYEKNDSELVEKVIAEDLTVNLRTFLFV